MACGTWSEPSLSPLPAEVKIINSGVLFDRPYEVTWWNYYGCALTAALAHALNRKGWDILFQLDHNCLVGAVNFENLLQEFLRRPEELLATEYDNSGGISWAGAWKRSAAVRYLHNRSRANLVDESQPRPILIEEELGNIFRGLAWFPWRGGGHFRQSYGVNPNAHELNKAVMEWPFVEKPHPSIIQDYIRLCYSRAVPVARRQPLKRSRIW